MKKVTWILACLLLFSSILAGCGGGNGNNGKDGSSANEGSDAVTELSFEVMIPKFGDDPSETLVQQEWQKEMEAYLGVKLNIKWNRVQWGNEFFEKSKVIVASGEIPDVMLVLGGASTISENGEKGLFADLTPYTEELPYYKEFIKGTNGAEDYLYSENNKIFAFYDGYNNPTEIRPSQYNPAYNYDVFEQAGLKIPETTDDFYNAAKKLKELYPDVYPVGVVAQDLALSGVYEMFHTKEDIYWNGEQFVFGPNEENFKAAVEFLHKLYAEKLLDPAFSTDTIDQARPKATTGKTFMYPLLWSGYVTEFNENNQSNTNWTNALPVNSSAGKGWLHSVEPLGKGLDGGMGIVISAKAKNPELLAKMLDYQYSDKMMDLMNWGVEGVTYEVKDGEKKLADSILNADNLYKEMEKYGVGTSGSVRAGIVFTPQDKIAKYTDPGSITSFYYDGEVKQESYWSANGNYGKDRIAPMDEAPRTVFTSDENETISNIMTPIRTYVTESVVNFIKGDLDLADWDKFQSQLGKLGDYESIVQMHNDKVK